MIYKKSNNQIKLKQYPEDIIRNLTDYNGYTREKAEELVDEIKGIIKNLLELHESRVLTQDYIKENIFTKPYKTLLMNNILIEIKDDDDLTSAYNYLVQKFNRDGGGVFYPVKTPRVKPQSYLGIQYKPTNIKKDAIFNRNIEEIECFSESVKDKFINPEDYELFIELMANYFCGNKPEMIQQTIKLERNSKTKVATIFNQIHRKIGAIEQLRRDTEYFKVIRCLEPFSKLDDSEIYKCITR